jgi:hypothetical protein
MDRGAVQYKLNKPHVLPISFAIFCNTDQYMNQVKLLCWQWYSLRTSAW